MLRRSIAVLMVLAFTASCSTVTIQPQAGPKLNSTPTHRDSRAFFLWGLAGTQRVDVRKICAGAPVRQMQSQQTFTDGLLGVITLGLYAPHTVKVWCDTNAGDA